MGVKNVKKTENEVTGVISDVKKKIEYWMDIAQYDLETARAMLLSKRFLYVGFMCHQVIEKSFKGYYVFAKSDNPPYTHSLRYLSQQSGLFETMDENQKDFIELLGPLNIQSRYPTYKERILKTLNRKKCDDILKKTEELFRWTKSML
jgi:HEPN domain-containing protein